MNGVEHGEFEELFLKITYHRMCDMYWPKLKIALEGVEREILWREPYPAGNMLGGIVLHVCEHIARSCLRLQNLERQLKPGFENYFPANGQTAEELLALFEAQLDDWKLLMMKYLSREQALEQEQVHQLYHLAEHTGYHLGQVLDRVQAATGRKFAFTRNGLNEASLREKIDAKA